jgi:hypothetical protein
MDAAVQLPRRRFTPDEFRRMGPLGIVPECAELIYGEVQDKTGRGTPHRWTYDQYVELGRAGIIREDERTELLDGEIVCMTPVGHRHIFVVDQLNRLLGEWLRGRALVRVQSPLQFNVVEAPQPDVVVLRMQEDLYRSRQAGPWDALLVIEVSDTSLLEDREVKAPKYARAAIPEFWIADLNTPSVIVHLNPIGGEYTDVRTYEPGESWVSPALGGRTVSVDEALGLPLPPR